MKSTFGKMLTAPRRLELSKPSEGSNQHDENSRS